MCKILTKCEEDDSVTTTLGFSFPLVLWLLQHDDDLEDEAHGVWSQTYGEEDDGNSLPMDYAPYLLELMGHAHENVRKAASIALANAIDVHPDTSLATLESMYVLYHSQLGVESSNISGGGTSAGFFSSSSSNSSSNSSSTAKKDKFAKFYGSAARANQLGKFAKILFSVLISLSSPYYYSIHSLF